MKNIFTFAVLLLSQCVLSAREVADCAGNVFDIPNENFKVVSLSPSVTEGLFCIGAADRVAACSRFCRFPKEALLKPKVGGFFDPDFERIASLKPKFVVIPDTANAALSKRLNGLGINVFLLGREGLKNISSDIRKLGELMNRRAEAGIVAKKIDDAILRNAGNSFEIKRAFLMFGNMAAGRTSYAGEALAAAGFENCAVSSAAWPIPNQEFIIAANPQVLVLERKPDSDLSAIAASYKNSPVWGATDAVKNGRIYFIDSDLISIPGPRMAEAIDELARIAKLANSKRL